MDERPRRDIFNGCGCGCGGGGVEGLALALREAGDCSDGDGDGDVDGDGDDGNGGGDEGAASERSLARSREPRREVAPARRAGEGRDITPRVRWRVPRGRIAVGGIRGSLVASEAELASGALLAASLVLVMVEVVGLGLGLGREAMSEVKWWREAWSCGLEKSVMRGMQRKCVSGGFGGMVVG